MGDTSLPFPTVEILLTSLQYLRLISALFVVILEIDCIIFSPVTLLLILKAKKNRNETSTKKEAVNHVVTNLSQNSESWTFWSYQGHLLCVRIFL